MSIQNKAKDIFQIGLEPTVNLVSSMFLSGVVGSVASGVVSAMMAYRQLRSEKMYERFMIETKRRQDELESQLQAMAPAQLEWFQNKVFPMVSDHALECDQEEKITYLVSGFIHAAGCQSTDEHVIRFYFDLLDRLSVLDLVILKNKHMYYQDESVEQLITHQMVLDGVVKNINQKLASMSLVETRGEKQYQDVIKSIEDLYKYLETVAKSKQPVSVRLPNLKVKSLGASRYELTDIGKRFLAFFCN